MFTGPTTIGDSGIFQLNGNLGIGTTALGLSGFTDAKAQTRGQQRQRNRGAIGPSALFGTANSSRDLTAALRGYATAGTETTFGVVGVSFRETGTGVSGNHIATGL